MKTIIKLVCETCGKEFERYIGEYNRNVKKGRGIYCSLKCSGKDNVDHLKKIWGMYNDNLVAGNRRDDYTGLRTHLTRAKRRNKECKLDLELLQDQWTYQSGSCPYSGVQLQHPTHRHKNNPLITASLDRIDSAIGYVSGNIQFVSISANHAKGEMTNEQMLEFCRNVANNFNTGK